MNREGIIKRYFSENTLVRMYCDFWRAKHDLAISVKGKISTRDGKTCIKECSSKNLEEISATRIELDAYSNINFFKEMTGEKQLVSDSDSDECSEEDEV